VSEGPDGFEYYRVSSIVKTENTGKLFYLVFADEGAEAVLTSEEFFDLLTTSSFLNM
jgi:hypothetical protein